AGKAAVTSEATTTPDVAKAAAAVAATSVTPKAATAAKSSPAASETDAPAGDADAAATPADTSTTAVTSEAASAANAQHIATGKPAGKSGPVETVRQDQAAPTPAPTAGSAHLNA